MVHEPLRIFADKTLQFGQTGNWLNPIIEAHWNDLTPSQRQEQYPVRTQVYQMVDSIDEADICSLPLIWRYYRNNNLLSDVVAFADRAAKHGKHVLIWDRFDFEPIIPFDNAILLHAGLNKSFPRRVAAVGGLPAFFIDFADIYFDGQVTYRPKREQPVIGFCGQAAGRTFSIGLWISRALKLRALHMVGKAPFVPPPTLPPYLFRGKILRQLEASPRVTTDFIVRDRYRAGVRNRSARMDPTHQTNRDYVDNIANTDYTVCVRGGGNYSVRFYHALCLGRIPVFVNTDCVLPFDSVVDWTHYVVWVEPHEVDFIGEKVADFHAALSPDEFVERQRACRTLWEQRLSVAGFHQHLQEYVNHARTF